MDEHIGQANITARYLDTFRCIKYVYKASTSHFKAL